MPSEILHILENRYLAALTSSGAACGGVAAAPGAGTSPAVAFTIADGLGFLGTSALLALAAAGILV